jgi:outer membrane protein assembly factor BamB
MESQKPIRWKQALILIAISAAAYAVIFVKSEWKYEQQRSMAIILTGLLTYLALLIWWLFISRAKGRTRIAGLGLFILPFLFFRVRGLTGNFIPIFESRFAKKATALAPSPTASSTGTRTDFPQFLGANRDATVPGIDLDPDWKTNPPQLLWRQPIGAAWSGFSIVGDTAITQEQSGETELVSAYHLHTGQRLWATANPGKYDTTIAGAGPRATPTIAGDRIFTLGATGVLRATALKDGASIWTRDLAAEYGRKPPEWGYASSPLIVGETVVVSIGAGPGKSLAAFRTSDGNPVWLAGDRDLNYSSPFLLTNPEPQLIMFNSHAITAHHPSTGAVLWEHPWGTGFPNVARPIPIAPGKVVFSSGYGVGSALLTITPGEKWTASQEWKTSRFQAKFSNPVLIGTHIYGVSDGIFACLDTADGKVKWKGGRFGHGQGLLLGQHYLQMTEAGELVLLRPTPEAENELARITVFDAKTWNTLAISGDLLLVRNDQEAACLRLKLKAQ